MITALAYGNNLLRMGNMAFGMLTPPSPYFIFEFSVADFVPTTNLLNSAYRNISTWTQVSSYPNRWKLELNEFGMVHLQSVPYFGLCFLFSNQTSGENPGYLIPSNLGGGYCRLIDSGNLDITDSNNVVCESMDRMFSNCTGLTYIEPIQCSNVQNVGGMFNNCTNVTEGAYDQYVWFNTYGININNHSGAFTNCGSNTVTGAAELAQIPVGWGGTLVPASTLMSTYLSKGVAWSIDANNPTWTNVKNGMYLFTESSVSKYAGVSMNRSRLYNKINSFSSATTVDEYYYPAFIQIPNVPTNSSTYQPTWIVTTETYNGMLVAKANTDMPGTLTDMPGTLDYGTYGTFCREYGTYDSIQTVYFVFLVTNTPIANWAGLSGEMAFLYNGNYNKDAKLRWFFES